MRPCLREDHLLRFVDDALSVEETEIIKRHLEGCQQCREHEESVRLLIGDLGADVACAFDAGAHARAVMARLGRSPEAPIAGGAGFGRRFVASAGLVAACAIVAGFLLGPHMRPAPARWQPRGGEGAATIGRDVAVQPYALQAGALRPLAPGATIEPTTPLTATFRNIGRTPAFLLLFAVDSDRVVHWISPPFVGEEDNPPSTPLITTANEKVLDTTAVLDDVPPGPLRLIAVITPAAARVADVEALEGSDLSPADLTRKLPAAEVRETLVHVLDTHGSSQ